MTPSAEQAITVILNPNVSQVLSTPNECLTFSDMCGADRFDRVAERADAPMMALAELLWKDEASAIVEQRIGRRFRGTRRAIWQQLVDSASELEIAEIVCAQLRQPSDQRRGRNQ